MKRFFLSMLLTILLSTGANSQIVPGYMGKKLSMSAGVEVAPLMGGLLPEKKLYDLQPKLYGSLQYVVSIRRELSLYADFRQSSTEVPAVPGSENMIPLYNDMWSVGLSLRTYRYINNGSIAPLGSYRSFTVGYGRSFILDDGGYLNAGIQKLGSNNSVLIGVGTGKQIIFKDRFLIDYGVKFALATQYLSYGTKRLDDKELRDQYTRFEVKAMKNLAANYLLTVYLEFGTLLH